MGLPTSSRVFAKAGLRFLPRFADYPWNFPAGSTLNLPGAGRLQSTPLFGIALARLTLPPYLSTDAGVAQG
jgi:hypothetical protein